LLAPQRARTGRKQLLTAGGCAKYSSRFAFITGAAIQIFWESTRNQRNASTAYGSGPAASWLPVRKNIKRLRHLKMGGPTGSSRWWRACALRSKGRSSANAKPDEIACIGFRANARAVMLEKRETSFAPHHHWCDQSTEKTMTDLEQRLAGAHHSTHLQSSADQFTLTKLLWVRDNERKIGRAFATSCP